MASTGRPSEHVAIRGKIIRLHGQCLAVEAPRALHDVIIRITGDIVVMEQILAGHVQDLVIPELALDTDVLVVDRLIYNWDC